MPITVQCEGCKTKLAVREKAAGRTMKCPKCYGPITVPTFMSGPVVNRVVRKTPLFDEPDLVITGDETEPEPPKTPTKEALISKPQAGTDKVWPIKVEVDAATKPAPSPMKLAEPSVDSPQSMSRLINNQASQRSDEAIKNLREEIHGNNLFESPLSVGTQKDDEAVAWDADPPWEAKMSLQSYFATCWAVLVHPIRTFGNLPSTENWRAVWYFLFAQILLCVSLVGLFIAIGLSGIEAMKEPVREVFAISGVMLAGFVGLAFISIFLSGFLFAWLLHVGLRSTGLLAGEFEATLRVAFYTGGAWATLASFPIVGPALLLAGVLMPVSWVYLVIGSTKAHDISIWRATLGLVLAVVYLALFGLVVWLMFYSFMLFS